MHTPTDSLSKPRLHPMVIAACSAIVLVCAVGTAAIMGWLPSSAARNTDASNLAQPVVMAPATAPVEAPVRAPVRAPSTSPQMAAAPVRNTTLHTEPRQQAAICSNCGVVESTREITTAAPGSGVGAVGGAVVGGVLGHQVGGGRGRDVATVLGALGGAFAGNHIEGQVKASHSYEIVVRLDDGSTRTLHQSAQPAWQAGDRVKVVNGALRSIG
ncbi:glycine zipper 2TM domain-containing protein [Rhodoferax sp. WC2427]|uniref:glycine zipper 2TM domain-containing protein n=1 Tax=Rhodoferax sp. WC2427 TaxID=3234144 RepID=UPI0034652514